MQKAFAKNAQKQRIIITLLIDIGGYKYGWYVDLFVLFIVIHPWTKHVIS